MRSAAATVDEYLASLPEDRRVALQQVRSVIRKNLCKGFAEGMSYGMIGWFVPHSLYPKGYHCDPKQPLPYAMLASQKQYMSLYMMWVYPGFRAGDEFLQQWKATGKKLDMGKCCLRFKRIEDLALDVIGRSFADMSMERWISIYESTLAKGKSGQSEGSSGGGKATGNTACKPRKASR